MFGALLGAGLGAIGGAIKPKVPTFDYKKEGMKFLTGYADDRLKRFQPVLDTMHGWASGKGLTMSAAERSKLAAGAIARTYGALKGVKQNINERMIGAGGAAHAGGMGQAQHLKADLEGLNAERNIHGDIAAQDIGKRVDRQMAAANQLTNLYNQDQASENRMIGQQFQNRVDRKLNNNRAYNMFMGAAGGAGGLGGLFSDESLKDNIEDTGHSIAGVPIKSWTWKDGRGAETGVVAQDVIKVHPDLVGMRDGYLTVDYAGLTKRALEMDNV